MTMVLEGVFELIDPQNQWALQIDVTNACNRGCSNCTRFVGHHAKPFFMSVETYAEAVQALRDFPVESPVHEVVENKVVGMLGGEPLLHPEFPELVKVLVQTIPRKEHRGLWTGLEWKKTKYAELIRDAFGFVNNNTHRTECRHSPILVSISDVIEDREERRQLIENCWLQKLWSGTITPKGFFFCEVAGAWDLLLDGPGGLPVEPGCWRRPLADFQGQIDRWCSRCGVPMNLLGRLDEERIDDISPSNLIALGDSPRIQDGQYLLYSGRAVDEKPWEYLR
ncbi:hypothetical protein [Petrachloros mirabilis]